MVEKKLSLAPLIDATATVTSSNFGRYTEVGARTKVAESQFGDYSYIVNDGDVIYTTVGKFCSIAAHVRINPGNHPMHRASQAHFTYRRSAYFEGMADDTAFFDWRRSTPVTIGHDVWIGHGAIILPGRTIGNGAVIAAGAVVTKDVAPYTIVGGVPATVLKRRFPAAIADRLQAIAWWDWPHAVLAERMDDFCTLPIEAFVEKYEGGA